MRLSKGVEWALHTTILLAQAPEGAWIPRKTIAEFYGLKEAYLAKYLQRKVFFWRRRALAEGIV